MCQYMIKVAEETKERACFRCEHGTFHLIWSGGVFSLSLETLYSLKILLIDARRGETLAVQKDGLRLQRHTSANGSHFFELWIVHVGIRLLMEDCHALENLVSATLKWVQAQSPFTPERHTQAAQLRLNMDSLPIMLESLHWN